jgi:hypothetical protein
MRTLGFMLAGALALGACGGNDAAPSLIMGGGVGSGAIDGKVNVYVIDEDTGSAIANAKVRVGKTDGTTDPNGLFTAKGDFKGAQDITAVASGHVPTMWKGVDGANVTIPVKVSGTGTPTVPQAELDATLDGWGSFNPLAQADALIGVVSYSQTTDFGAAENNIPQPTGPVAQLPQITGNMCVKATGISPNCAPKINSRTGSVALVAAIADVNFNGTATTSDDVYTILGYAAKTGITVDNGVSQTGLELTQIAAGNTITGMVQFGTPPASLTNVTGLVGLDLGPDGVAFVPDPLRPNANTLLLPTQAGLTGLTYRVVATATLSTTDNDTESLILKHGLTDPSHIMLGDWMGTPTGIMANGDTMSFSGVTSGVIEGFDIIDSSGATAWSVSIFDGTTTATLPTDLAPIPTGTNTLKVTAIDATIDLGSFNLADKFDLVNRLSSDKITFTK